MFNKGDVIIGTIKSNKEVIRRIVEVIAPFSPGLEIEETSYMWEYPDLPSNERNLFWSGNSSDPEFEFWILFNQ